MADFTKSNTTNAKTKNATNDKPKMIDILDVDKPISGQAFGCFSFISPEKILKQKELFYFNEFISTWEMSKSMEKFSDFLGFISYKYKLSIDSITKDYEQFINEEKEKMVESTLLNDYKNFIDKHENDLDKRFNKKNAFQTSVRGFKSRGNFDTQEEAEFRAKMLREHDPGFDIFVGPVGQWLCWEPDAYKTGKVEYMEEELNHLAHEKHKNESAAKIAFESRVKDSKEKAIQDNVASAKITGQKLTQTIDASGNLIEINEKVDENINVSSADIRAELIFVQ